MILDRSGRVLRAKGEVQASRGASHFEANEAEMFLAADGRWFMKKTHAIHYDELPEKQVAGVLSENVLFIFINPTEYHGPHLPLANDYLISRGRGRDSPTVQSHICR